jgi:hypothetical protein
MANNLTVPGTRDLPTDCRFAQDQTGVLAVFSLYYQRIDRGWPAVQAGGEQGCIDAAQRDRLPVAQCDHRIAVGVVGQIGLDVAKAAGVGKADQIDFERLMSKR